MAIDQWGRWVPDYAQNIPSNVPDYREELKRQRDTIDYRLSELDKRYQPQEPPSQPMMQQQTMPVPKTITQPYTIVASEQEARDYPIVNSFNDDIGKVHFFAMNDESSMFAKRINPSTFEMEFEIYDKRIKAEKIDNAPDTGEKELLINIDSRLSKIEQFVDGALAMFMNSGGTAKPIPETPKAKGNKSTSGKTVADLLKNADPPTTETGEE